MENKGRKIEGSPYHLGKNGGPKKIQSSPRTPHEKSNYDLSKARQSKRK